MKFSSDILQNNIIKFPILFVFLSTSDSFPGLQVNVFISLNKYHYQV